MVKLHSHANNPEEWLTYLTSLRGDKNLHVLKNALSLYPDSHSPLLKKGLGIADILLSLGLDNETLAITLIYPAYHARIIHTDTATEHLGESGIKLLHDVAQMESLGKLQQLDQRSGHQLENLRKMLLAMVSDVRAVLVVLAERLWQLRHAKELAPDEQVKLATETFHVFAPLANRLGVWQLKWEIEDLCLRYLKPDVYSELAKGLASRRQEREEHITRVITLLNKLLKDAGITQFEVTGRVKHINSIYNKMQRKNVSLDKIYDMGALRVLVPEIADCYTVLSVLSASWQQIPEEFDDYIAHPKSNGYRSIHTVVVGPENRIIEIQIRTHQMHQESELGVAAHWRYKEGVLQTSHYEAKIALLRQVMAWQKEVVNDPKQALQDIFTDRIYVFTPMGDIVDLPQGATPLDFAYHIHSEVGHRCRGAKIGKNIVPLTYQLKTGECVEILTAKEANPSRDWLNIHLGYLKTSRARAKAQHWFRVHDSTQNILEGREAIDREAKRLRIHEKIDLGALATKLNYKQSDDLLAAIGIGDISAAAVINHIRKTPSTPHIPIPSRHQETKKPSSVQIFGVNNLLTQTARCCKPLPGDDIIGYITRNKGVSIHRRDCGNLIHATRNNKQRLIEVSWGEKQAQNHPVDIMVRAVDRAGLLRDITAVLATEKLNVLALQTQKSHFTPDVSIYITIEITSLAQLNKSIDLLQQLTGILKVVRR